MATHTESFIIKLLLRGVYLGKHAIRGSETGICRYAHIDAWYKKKSGGSDESQSIIHPYTAWLTTGR